MIDNLIDKYITQFNERQYKLNLIDYHLKKEPYKQSLLDERHDIERDISKYNEFIKDLEELKENLMNGEGMENLADIEHKRWANWQSYLHSLCIENEDGSLTIPKERVEHWEWEIATDYNDLPDNIKEYDREEVRNTLKEIIGDDRDE